MAAPGSYLPLRIGLAGLGRAGVFHLERISLREDCQVVAAYDPSVEATRKAADLVSHCAESWQGLLKDERVELVLLATPPASHAPMAIEALAAGKHVLVETPLGLSLAEADAILASARCVGRSVIVAQTHRWDRDFRATLNEIGGLGRLEIIKHINWHLEPIAPAGGREGAIPASSSHDPSPSWRDDPAIGGGPLWEFGIHDFDKLRQLAGEAPSEITAEFYHHGDAGGAEAGFLAIVRFPSGLLAHVEVHHAAAYSFQTGWIVVGSGGSTADDRNFTLAGDREVVDVPRLAVGGKPNEFHSAVVAHLRGEAANPVPAEQARDTIALIEAARKSALTGRPVPVER
jgi:predicted dehydrogenase